MHIIIAYSTSEDVRYFPAALPGHEVTTLDALAGGDRESVEALAVVNGKPVSRELLATMPKLKLVVTRSTGYDHIDPDAAAARGIAVCNVPEYGAATVAEFTFGLILSLTRNIPQAVANSRRGVFTVEGLMGTDLAGKTLGVVGLGKIGRNVVRMAQGFSMEVLAHDPYKDGSVPLETLLSTADVIALCCPLTPETDHLMNAAAFALVKPTAFLVNTARGPVVDSEALLEAVDSHRLAGAAIDVLEGEEALLNGKEDENMARNRALMNHPSVLVTPHLAFDSVEALARIRQTTAEILRAFADGRIVNQVPSSLPLRAATGRTGTYATAR